MRKFLLTLCTLLMAVGSAWADDTTVTIVDGTKAPYDTYGTRNSDKNLFTTNATSGLAGLTISIPVIDRATWWSTYCLAIKTSGTATDETITMTAPEGYIITGYSVTLQACTSNYPYDVTVGGSTSTVTGASAQTFSESDLTAQTASFTVNATKGPSNWLAAKAWTITVVDLETLKANYITAHTIAEANLGKVGYPTSAGKTAFEAAINAITDADAFATEAATALAAYKETIVYPAGTYYIKNNYTGCYAYADDNTEAVTRVNKDNTADHTSNNYIWTVSSTDNVFTINNLYSLGFTKANENSFTTESTTTPTTLHTDPFGDYAGAFYLEGAHNNNVYTTSDGTGYVVSWAYNDSPGSYWVFEEVDNSSLTTYTVTVQNVDASLDPVELSDGTVLNAGTATIYWSGTMTESDITQNEVAGFSIPETGAIVIDGTTVTITYAPSYETLMTNYMTENNIAAKLALAGSLGYPKTTTGSYTNLNTLVTNIADNYNATGWANLKAYYAAYVDETDVVLPSTGSFYRIMGYATNKYAKTGTAGSAIPNSEGTATDGSDLWYYNTDNTLINYANGLGTIGTKFYATVDQTKETATFQHSTCTATSGVKFGLFEIISNYSGSKYWYSNTSNVDRNSANNNVNCEWELTEVTSLPVTISTAKYASFYAPVAVRIPEGVTAYVATDKGDYLTLSAITDGIIPAGTGVILYADITEATTYSFSITTSEGSATSDLTGSVATITKPVDAYYLSNGNSGIGFYKGGSATTLAGFKAYLENGTDGEVKTFRFKDVTAIEALKAAQQAGTTYDLSGRRVQRPVKGIFIQDGKKVVIK